ncbi:MAG: hypothetical protein U0R26_03085 [Solirubrobacterales bacterium]
MNDPDRDIVASASEAVLRQNPAEGQRGAPSYAHTQPGRGRYLQWY